jgi:adenylate cyclase
MPEQHQIDSLWHELLTTGEPNKHKKFRRIFAAIPSSPRCQMCNAPYTGIGGFFMKTLFNKKPFNKNPKFCGVCADFAVSHRGGAEIELTMLFADIRGSTTIAEKMSPLEFSRLLNRFYAAANSVLVESDAFIDKMVGDEVIGLYLPGFAGQDHAMKGINAAVELLKATGHEDSNGPWAPVGIGVHTGVAYVGTVGSHDTVSDVTALGDAMNVTARLSSAARQGEILMTHEAARISGIATSGLEERDLALKGKTESTKVFVRRIGRAS